MIISEIATGLAVAFLSGIGASTNRITYSPFTYYFQTGIPANPCTDILVCFECTPDGTTCTGPDDSLAAGNLLFETQNGTSGICEIPLKRL
jgi:hypothetical protein